MSKTCTERPIRTRYGKRNCNFAYVSNKLYRGHDIRAQSIQNPMIVTGEKLSIETNWGRYI
jgi:hypothetical protein